MFHGMTESRYIPGLPLILIKLELPEHAEVNDCTKESYCCDCLERCGKSLFVRLIEWEPLIYI